MFVLCCSLFVCCCLLCVACCMLYVVRCALSDVGCFVACSLVFDRVLVVVCNCLNCVLCCVVLVDCGCVCCLVYLSFSSFFVYVCVCGVLCLLSVDW